MNANAKSDVHEHPLANVNHQSSTARLRIWTLRIWGFRGPGFRSARQVLCGDASHLCLDHFSKHPSSVLGRTELCHKVRNPGPQKPQIIRNENHHLALFAICYRKTDRKGHFCRTPAGCPRDTRPSRGFQKFYVIFSYVPFLLPRIATFRGATEPPRTG